MENLICFQQDLLFGHFSMSIPQPLCVIHQENSDSKEIDIKIRTSKIQSKKKKKYNRSLWTLKENLKYLEFLQLNQELFQSSKQNRRQVKINKMISVFVKTRNPDQCRSHHQKMMKYHGSISGICQHILTLRNLSGEIGKEVECRDVIRLRKKIEKKQEQQIDKSPDTQKILWDVLLDYNQHNQSYYQ